MKLLMKLKPQNKLKNSDFEINLTEDSKLRSKSILPTQKIKGKKLLLNNNEISSQQKAIPKIKRSKRRHQNWSVITSPQSEADKIMIPTLNTQQNNDLNGTEFMFMIEFHQYYLIF